LVLTIEELEPKTAEEDFWNDPQEAQKILKMVKAYKDKIESYARLN
jgi:hypothetical protein